MHGPFRLSGVANGTVSLAGAGGEVPPAQYGSIALVDGSTCDFVKTWQNLDIESGFSNEIVEICPALPGVLSDAVPTVA